MCIRDRLYTSPPELPKLLNSIQSATASNVLVQTHHQWLSKSSNAATADVSNAIIASVNAGHATDQTIDLNNTIIFVVGLPVPAVETQVYEVFQLKNLEPVSYTHLDVYKRQV